MARWITYGSWGWISITLWITRNRGITLCVHKPWVFKWWISLGIHWYGLDLGIVSLNWSTKQT